MSDTEKLLKIVAKQLGGTLKNYQCYEYGDKNTQHKKYVIEYGHEERK
jgi:hypothetical protein|tara:strand:- start:973 stop:1116 length:144 start_codon:yes stop_codon:yes gene_type:complete